MSRAKRRTWRFVLAMASAASFLWASPCAYAIDYVNWGLLLEVLNEVHDALKKLETGADVAGIGERPKQLDAALEIGRKLAQEKVEDQPVPLNRSLTDLTSSDLATMKATVRDIENWVAATEKSLGELRNRQKTYQEIYESSKKFGDELHTARNRWLEIASDPKVDAVLEDQALNAYTYLHYDLIPAMGDIEVQALRLSREYTDLISRRTAEAENAKANLETLIRPYARAREQVEAMLSKPPEKFSAATVEAVESIAAKAEETAKRAGAIGLEASKSADNLSASTGSSLYESAQKAKVDVTRAQQARNEALRQQREKEFREYVTQGGQGGTQGSPGVGSAGSSKGSGGAGSKGPEVSREDEFTVELIPKKKGP